MSPVANEVRPTPTQSVMPLLIVVVALCGIVAGALLIVPLVVDDLAGKDWEASIPVLFGRNTFWVLLAVVLILPALLAAHYRVVGPKVFKHTGRRFLVFSLATRINHWIAALSGTVLILTGLTMMFAAAPGTRETVDDTDVAMIAWRVHAVTATVFATSAALMLIQWARKMLPKMHDLRWLRIAGGYLTRKKQRVPADMFNFGQKMWFWLATLGGLVMAGTGATIFLFVGGDDLLNVAALIHHGVAALIVAMFIVHVYMAVFAVKGSLRSMIDGMKCEEELAILHGIYYDEVCEPAHAHGLGRPPPRAPLPPRVQSAPRPPPPARSAPRPPPPAPMLVPAPAVARVRTAPVLVAAPVAASPVLVPASAVAAVRTAPVLVPAPAVAAVRTAPPTFSGQAVLTILKEAEAGAELEELCRKYGIGKE